MTWTHFWDMHSGGGCKEPPFEHIYIEAAEAEAVSIFYSRFGHNPRRVSCTCCGDDYVIDEGHDLGQLTAYHRGCRFVEPVRQPNFQVVAPGFYIEADVAVPAGRVVSPHSGSGHRAASLEEYLRRSDVLCIRAESIAPEERHAAVPEQGYVWRD